MQVLTARADRPGAVVLAELDVIAPGAGQIQVQVAAASINYVDPAIVSGALHAVFGLPDSVGLGFDLAGTVSAVGPGVSGFAVGDRVAGLFDDMTAPARAQATVATIPATDAALVPDGLELAAAATIPLNGLTAAQAVERLGEPAGRTLLVTGGAGAVGGFALTLARQAGWRVSALARPEDGEFVLAAGAQRLLAELPAQPAYDAVLDAAVIGAPALRAVVVGGAYVGLRPNEPVEAERGIDVAAITHRPDAATLARLLRLAADGGLPTRVAGTVSLAEASAAYEKVAAGGQRGRWVITP
jgi:NADPH:quinone reductase-like Zn-dependent oxidoreductase